uniref:Amino acid transporter n=1 Tax=Globisporangium ultimum (strain ATCC 200006 / CBS 805.95 / DAOM BR144) TaxID=431595 RepID=K3WWW7_GLOUD
MAATPREETGTLGGKLKEWYFGIPGILVGAILGILAEWALSTGSPSNEFLSWIDVPDNLFIRVIKRVVTPLVLCSLIVEMTDILALDKASSIGVCTGLLYLLCTVVAAAEGAGLLSILQQQSQGHRIHVCRVRVSVRPTRLLLDAL